MQQLKEKGPVDADQSGKDTQIASRDRWKQIKKSCTISITKGLKIKKGIKKAIKTPIQDGFTIGGFKSSRTNK